MRATNVIPLLGEMGVAQKGCRRAKVAPTLNNKRFKPFKAFPLNFLIPNSLLLITFLFMPMIPQNHKIQTADNKNI